MTDAEIVSLQTQMEKGFDKLESLMTGVEARVRAMETTYAGAHPVLVNDVAAFKHEIYRHKDQIDKLEEAVTKLAQTNSILKWLLGVLSTVGVATLLKMLFPG